MLSMIVYYHCKDGKLLDFLTAEGKAHIAKRCQGEPGNVQYEYFLPLDKPDTVLLLEKWETEEAQRAHLDTENFKLLSEIKAQFVESTKIERYVV